MVQEYNRKVEEARQELLEVVRSNTDSLVRSGYQGEVGLGHVIENGHIIYYRLKMGRVYRGENEISAQDVPFHRYSSDGLRMAAEDIEDSLNGMRKKKG